MISQLFSSGHEYTHGHTAHTVANHSTRTAADSCAYLLSYLDQHPNSYSSLLDVGCGPGSITSDLAQRFGRVCGVDAYPEVLRVAQERYPDVEFRQASVYDLSGSDLSASGVPASEGAGGDHSARPCAKWDVVHAHQVLQHLDRPVAALKEMGAVCQPGGLIAVRDAIYRSFSWFPQVPGMDAWLGAYRAVARANGACPDAGVALVHWAVEAGFARERCDYRTSTWTYQTPEAVQWLSNSWANRTDDEQFRRQCREYGVATSREVDEMVQAWREWGTSPDAVFVMTHGELLIQA